MKLVDTHCHLNFRSYDSDRAQVLERARATGVTRTLLSRLLIWTVAIRRSSSPLATKNIFAAVGIHPNSSGGFVESILLSPCAGSPAMPKWWRSARSASTTTGTSARKPTQWRAFESQLALASELGAARNNVHNREASKDLMAMLEDWAPGAAASLNGRLGVLHSFSASGEIAERALALGFFLGFTGPVTFTRRRMNFVTLRDIRQSVASLSRLMDPFWRLSSAAANVTNRLTSTLSTRSWLNCTGVTADEMARQTTCNAEQGYSALPAA